MTRACLRRTRRNNSDPEYNFPNGKQVVDGVGDKWMRMRMPDAQLFHAENTAMHEWLQVGKDEDNDALHDFERSDSSNGFAKWSPYKFVLNPNNPGFNVRLKDRKDFATGTPWTRAAVQRQLGRKLAIAVGGPITPYNSLFPLLILLLLLVMVSWNRVVKAPSDWRAGVCGLPIRGLHLGSAALRVSLLLNRSKRSVQPTTDANDTFDGSAPLSRSHNTTVLLTLWWLSQPRGAW